MRALAIAGLIVLLLPSAAAAEEVRFGIDRAGHAAFVGETTLLLPAGAARVQLPADPDTFSATGLTGEWRVYTWRVARHETEVDGAYALERAQLQRYRVENASLHGILGGQSATFDLDARAGGELSIRGWSESAGAPRFVANAYERPSHTLPDASEAEDVRWRWEEGWPLYGPFMPVPPGMGLPAWETPRLGAQGELLWKVHGATLQFVDATGAAREVRSGEREEVGSAGIGVQTWTRAIFEGRIASLDAPLRGNWGAAAPTATALVDGALTLQDAEGWIERDGERSVVRESLVLEGDLRVAIARGAGALDAAAYEGSGAADVTILDGATLRASAPPAPSGGTLGLLALALAALAAAHLWAGDVAARLAAPLYTRLSRHGVLEHPTRAAIDAIARAEPGIHLRELHRRVGGAWGAFSFHVRMMQKLGVLELRRDGRYLAVATPGSLSATAAPRSEVARRILAELAAAGGSLPRDALRERVGVSRQLLRYHLQALKASQAVVEDAGMVWLAALASTKTRATG